MHPHQLLCDVVVNAPTKCCDARIVRSARLRAAQSARGQPTVGGGSCNRAPRMQRSLVTVPVTWMPVRSCHLTGMLVAVAGKQSPQYETVPESSRVREKGEEQASKSGWSTLFRCVALTSAECKANPNCFAVNHKPCGPPCGCSKGAECAQLQQIKADGKVLYHWRRTDPCHKQANGAVYVAPNVLDTSSTTPSHPRSLTHSLHAHVRRLCAPKSMPFR